MVPSLYLHCPMSRAVLCMRYVFRKYFCALLEVLAQNSRRGGSGRDQGLEGDKVRMQGDRMG